MKIGKIKLDVIFVKYKGLFVSFSILAISILISIMLFSLVPSGTVKTVEDNYSREGAVQSAPVSILDFELENFPDQFSAPGIYYKRPVLKKWDTEQVKKFWIPVEDILLDMTAKENSAELKRIFSEVE